MAIFKEILRNDGSGITRFYRIDNGSITTLDYDALMNKPRINGKELIGDILIDISDFDLSNYYTKKETNTTIQVQLANYYTKKETDNQITKRITEVSTPDVDLTDYYTKAETEALVEEKIEEAKGQDTDLTNYYTKTETDVLIEEKIGEIVIPEVDLTDYYTKAETDNKIEGALESIEIPEIKIDPNTWVVDGYNVVEEDPTSSAPVHYTVEPFGSGYGFEFREDGAYHALNVGVDNSYAMCKIVFKNIGGPTGHFILNFTQKSDYENDYGIISNTDEELIDNLESEEHAQMVLNQGGTIQHPEMMLASYANTTHSIVVKYKKDGEGSYDGEEFSFKVGENGMAVPHILKNKKLVDEDKLNISYYDKEETEAKINEKLQEFEAPTTDLSDYYNKSQTDAKIDEKINDIPVSDLLHYKGHVGSVDLLPSVGQQSEPSLSTTLLLKDATLSTLNANNCDSAAPRDRFNYFMNVFETYSVSYGHYFVGFAGRFGSSDGIPFHGFITEYPEQLFFTCYDSGSHRLPCLIAKYDVNKPVYYFQSTYSKQNVFTFTLVTADKTITGNGASSRYDSFCGFDNTSNLGWSFLYLNNPIKYSPYNGTQSLIANSGTEQFCYSGNTYMIKPNTDYTPLIQMSESVARLNDTYTVGNNHDIYRCNELPAWEHWSKAPDTYSKEEIDNMFGDINTVLTEIVEGGE